MLATLFKRPERARGPPYLDALVLPTLISEKKKSSGFNNATLFWTGFSELNLLSVCLYFTKILGPDYYQFHFR